MKEISCPNCELILEVHGTTKDVVCNKCLEKTGRSFIMGESSDTQQAKYLGGGLFESPNK